MLVAARGQTPPPAEPAMTPEMAALVATLPAWSGAASIEAGFGYKDNLLLSHAGEREAPSHAAA